ncbi:MAG: nucleotidyl transferase AbiEii/AbiGii toxin family protein [Beijerinckiaceae bacterium]
MAPSIEPRLDILPDAQRAIWSALRPSIEMGLVLYGGTAVALRLGHRNSLDFDFFCANPLDKSEVRNRFAFMPSAEIVQDAPNTLVALARTSVGEPKVSFFGGINFGRIGDPSLTVDGTLLIASPEDLLATKLKAILDRAEAKDYQDIAALLRAGVSLERSLAGFQQMFAGEPATVLRAIGYFGDGDLRDLPETDRELLRQTRDNVRALPNVTVQRGALTG